MLGLHGITVRFGATTALRSADVEVADGETVAVVGPSGSGKTTLLRVAAGLVRDHEGRVTWDGRDITATPPHTRRFGFVFQDYALFPHRSVARNVSFGLEMAKLPADEMERRVSEALAIVSLESMASRSVTELSGGEQQRVALARALAPRPRMLMFDEPLGALDRELRTRLLGELVELLDGLAIPALYVTHDQEEALALGDRVAVMNEGEIVQIAPAEGLWSNPRDEFVARFMGYTNMTPYERKGPQAVSAWGDFPLPPVAPDEGLVAARPEHVVRDQGGLQARVEHVVFRGGAYEVTLRTDRGSLLARWDSPPANEPVHVGLDRSGIVFVPRTP